MSEQKMLLVEDEVTLKAALTRAFERKGFEVYAVSSKQDALKLNQPFDIALVDLRLPDGDGIELMTQLKTANATLQVIILTGFATIETAIDATKKGAYHFVTKPFNIEEILNLVDKSLAQKRLETENSQLKSALHHKYRFDNIVGQSGPISDVLNLVEKVAQSDSTVLITGESGTGKELIAKAVHYNSLRANRPFIPINCGAIPSELLESELFGHVKGAFTSAVNNRIGRFELAEKGTLFFDEIGDMSPSLQVKLLRVLQEKCFEPVGSPKTIISDVRVIAATNIDLERAVAEGRFREDLYYRLNVIPMKLPALRERKSDIPLLLHYFIDSFNENRKEKLTGITPEALELLYNYPWPGNIRELENLVERLSILKGSGIVDVVDLPEKYRQYQNASISTELLKIPDAGMDFNSAVDNFENSLIMRALEKTGWNRNQAAILLRLNRTTLVEKIKKKGLRPPEISM